MNLAHKLIVAIFFISADLGIASSADSFVFALISLFIYPSSVPYLLIASISIQDSAGLSYFWSYATTYILSIIYILKNKKLTYIFLTKNINKEFFFILISAIFIIVYALYNSIIQQNLGGLEQDIDKRNPYLISVLMILNVLTALTIVANKDRIRGLSALIITIMLHMLFITLLQVIFGSTTIHSANGIEDLNQSSQLIELSAFGLPRLTSTFLSPNTFAQTFILLFLINLNFIKNPLRISTAMYLFIISILISFFTQSKSMAGFSLFLSLYMFSLIKHKPLYIFIGTLFLILITLIYLNNGGLDLNKIQDGLRINTDTDSNYRLQTISTVINSMTLKDWIFGMGLSHWPILLGNSLNFELSDPHIWVLSIPGTYGFFGILFYIFIVINMMTRIKSNNLLTKFTSVALLIKLLLFDLFSIPYLLNNSNLSMLTWIIFCLINIKLTQKYSRELC